MSNYGPLYTGKIKTQNGYRYVTIPSENMKTACYALSQGLHRDETLIAVMHDIIKPMITVENESIIRIRPSARLLY